MHEAYSRDPLRVLFQLKRLINPPAARHQLFSLILTRGPKYWQWTGNPGNKPWYGALAQERSIGLEDGSLGMLDSSSLAWPRDPHGPTHPVAYYGGATAGWLPRSRLPS